MGSEARSPTDAVVVVAGNGDVLGQKPAKYCFFYLLIALFKGALGRGALVFLNLHLSLSRTNPCKLIDQVFFSISVYRWLDFSSNYPNSNTLMGNAAGNCKEGGSMSHGGQVKPEHDWSLTEALKILQQ